MTFLWYQFFCTSGFVFEVVFWKAFIYFYWRQHFVLLLACFTVSMLRPNAKVELSS